MSRQRCLSPVYAVEEGPGKDKGERKDEGDRVLLCSRQGEDGKGHTVDVWRIIKTIIL